MDHVIDDDACLLARQFESDRLADPAVAACNDGNLVLQRHDQPLNLPSAIASHSPARRSWSIQPIMFFAAELLRSSRTSYFSRRTGRRLVGFAGGSSVWAWASLANRSAFKRSVFARVART